MLLLSTERGLQSTLILVKKWCSKGIEKLQECIICTWWVLIFNQHPWRVDKLSNRDHSLSFTLNLSSVDQCILQPLSELRLATLRSKSFFTFTHSNCPLNMEWNAHTVGWCKGAQCFSLAKLNVYTQWLNYQFYNHHVLGGKHSSECTLILTEGDSAKSLAVSGLGVIGRDRYGVFPLRGKILNVREATHKQVSDWMTYRC